MNASKPNDGGPTWQVPGFANDPYNPKPGMSLRACIAKDVAAGLAANSVYTDDIRPTQIKNIVEASVEIADALIAKLEEGNHAV